MIFLKNKKNSKLALLVSSFALFSSCLVSINNSKSLEVDAYINDRAYIAIDSAKGIGYLSSTYQEFMMKTNYFCDFDLTIEREDTIFLQDMYQGSQSFLNDIKTILIVDEVRLDCCDYLFKGLQNLQEIVNIDNLNVSNCRSFVRMFEDTPNLKTIDFKDFDLSSCGDLSEMFAESSFETLDLSSFDTSSCSHFEYMFAGCKNIVSLDLSSFETKNATKMESMFSGCASLEYLDISSFDLSKSPYTEYFFKGTKPKIIAAPKCVPEYLSHRENVVSFYLPHVVEEQYYYYDVDLNNYLDMIPANESIIYYNETDIKNSVESFAQSASTLLNSLENLPTPDVDDLRLKWDTLTGMDFSIYYNETDYNAITKILKLCKTDTINETVSEFLTLYEELYKTYCHGLVDCGGDFLGRLPNALNPDGLVHLGVNTTTNIGYISPVDSYEILKSDLKTKVNTTDVTYENSIFSLLGPGEYEDITKIVIQDEITIPSYDHLFKGLSKVTSIEGIENLKTISNLSTASMFEDCSSLENLDLSSLDTTNVRNADQMFKGCTKLTDIKSLKFTSKNLISISEMFYGCESLVLLDLSDFDLTNVVNTVNCLDYSSFLYLRTPKAMPSKTGCDLNLYFPFDNPSLAYYDKSFSSYTKVSKDDSSILLISTIGKTVLDKLCKRFNDDCEYYCASDGTTSQDRLIKLWEDEAEYFTDHLVDTPNGCLIEFLKQDNSSSIDTALKTFSEKYDYIYGKYHLLLDEHGGDFAQRTNLINFMHSALLSSYFFETNNTNIIVAVVIVTISVSLVLFYVSRRKHSYIR